MPRVDFEAHYYPREFVDLLKDRMEIPYIKDDYLYYAKEDGRVRFSRIGGPDGVELIDLGEERINAMDAAGTDMQVLSCAQGIELLEPELAVRLSRIANEHVYDAMQRYPGRFQGMAALPMCDVDASILEMERCVKQFGFVGWNVFSCLGDTFPDDERYEPLFAKAAELGIFVYLHPAFTTIDRLHGLGPQLLTAVLGFGLDALITFTRIMARGIFDRYPGLKLFLGHLGETIPYVYDRMSNNSADEYAEPLAITPAVNKRKFGHYFQNNLLVTTSGMYSQDAFLCAKHTLGIDHIFFGCDYPMDKPQSHQAEFIDSLPLTAEEREKVLYRNAKELIGIGEKNHITLKVKETYG